MDGSQLESWECSSGLTPRRRDRFALKSAAPPAFPRQLDSCSALVRTRGLRWLGLARGDHNSQTAPRPRPRPGPQFRARVHAQTQKAETPASGPQLPECSACLPPPRPRWRAVSKGPAVARGPLVPGAPGGAGAGARQSLGGGGGVRLGGGRQGHERVPPGQGRRERVRGHRGRPLQD